MLNFRLFNSYLNLQNNILENEKDKVKKLSNLFEKLLEMNYNIEFPELKTLDSISSSILKLDKVERDIFIEKFQELKISKMKRTKLGAICNLIYKQRYDFENTENKEIIYNVIYAGSILMYQPIRYDTFLRINSVNISSNCVLNILVGLQSSIYFIEKILKITAFIVSNKSLYKPQFKVVTLYGCMIAYCLYNKKNMDYELLNSNFNCKNLKGLLEFFNDVNNQLFTFSSNLKMDKNKCLNMFTANFFDVPIKHLNKSKCQVDNLINGFILLDAFQNNLLTSTRLYLDKMVCEKCKTSNNFINNKWINRLLIFDFSLIKIDMRNLEYDIDLSELIYNPFNVNQSYKFNLISIITKQNELYSCYSKSIVDNKWRRFGQVDEIKLSEINEQIYMLIYQKQIDDFKID